MDMEDNERLGILSFWKIWSLCQKVSHDYESLLYLAEEPAVGSPIRLVLQ